ncbi:purine-nucleoside phosphorylase [Mycoplasmopsis californica]|uniref:Uridine phosphorylase n=1 Tax=Mycoplasmopsis equigenitalium TaxID=114883 RepID=A0ABY5J4I8_9BACT|nr:purine-nucleoside phosphorylase [Mycoplasmopsis equigenitalium]UUD36801.1 purine-nucleoside phosphorylase [Mycoplasmopsis equigenitalium]VEU69901.1 purine-nucleoside phosphorylase [Mycoplasmopsis californica]
MATPHIACEPGEIAKVVLMPGDPLRAELMAKKYLKDVKLVSAVRNIYFYTGYYNGKKITIGASGMGPTSIGIYAYELFNFYDVDTIVRLGSAGAYLEDLSVKTPVLVTSAVADGYGFVELMTGKRTLKNKPDAETLTLLKNSAKNMNVNLRNVCVHTTDVFYSIRPLEQTLKITKSDCVDNECFALFATAQRSNKKAAALLSISENLITHESMTSDERLKEFSLMFEIALNAFCK